MRAAPVEEVPPDAPAMTLAAWTAYDGPGELVGGRLVEGEVPDAIHETVVGFLVVQLSLWAKLHGARVFGSGLKYGVAEDRGRMPDVSVWLEGRRPPGRGLVTAPPDLAVEVVSPTPADARRDRIEKLVEYAAFGVRWYWLVDPGLRTLEVLELRDGAYAHRGGASTGRVADLPGLPGLEVDLDALWAEVDDLA